MAGAVTTSEPPDIFAQASQEIRFANRLVELKVAIDPNYNGKGLQFEFTVEDESVFTTPYSATVTYLRGSDRHGSQEWPELVCAENPHEYSGEDTALPHADASDF
jgi:hypothetical protein